MTTLSNSFLEHASQCSSQYDETCRTMAAEILALRESLKDAKSFLEIALKTSITHKSTGKGGHDGNGNSWTECAGIPEWRARQMLEEWNTVLDKANPDSGQEVCND